MDTLQQNHILPVQELWKESYLALSEIEVPPGISLDDPWRDLSNFIIIMALTLFLIFAHRRILIGLANVMLGIFNIKRLIGIENQSNIQVCRNTLFQFLTLCVSFVFANIAYATKIIGNEYTLPVRFVGILGFITIFFICRKIALRFLAWLNRVPKIKLIHKISYTYACLWYILVLCCFLVIKSIPSAPMGYMRYCMIYSLLPVLAIYFYSIFRIFVPKGFSHFFYILYLCTLEILPIVLLLYLNFS